MGAPGRHWARAGPLALAALCLFACQPAAAPFQGAPGRTRFAIQPPPLPGLLSADYTFRFYFLGQLPVQAYATYMQSSNAIASAVLTCREGLNQVVLDATLHFSDGSTQLGHAAALFSCVHEADTAVNLVVSILRTGAYGDADLGALALATSCDSRADLKGDDALAVCASSSCGDASAAFVFTNYCRALDGSAPTWLACGAPADWTLLGPLGRAQLPVPAQDGSWAFSVAALGVLQLPIIDPTLTDSTGKLRVWAGTATPRVALTRSHGALTQQVTPQTAPFAALLDVSASAHALLEIRHPTGGAQAYGWAAFAPCDRAALGIPSWPGLFAVDLRLVSPGAAKVYLGPQIAGIATKSATCTAVLAADGMPGVQCTAASALGSTP